MAITKQDVQNLKLKDNIITDIDDLLTQTDGGVISSDITLHKSDLHILSGNFVQTASEVDKNIFNWSSKNAFIQAEEAWNGAHTSSYGIACAGCLGYVILSVDALNNGLKLDGDLSKMTSNAAALSSAWSFALDESSGASCLYIDHVDAPYVYFKSLPVVLAKLSTLSEEECKRIAEVDDNGIYCPKYPDVGLSTLKTFYAQHVEGGSTKAFGKYAHTEGRATIADCRYAHAEGSETYAGGIGSHAEGFYSMSMGRGSHAEGKKSLATKDMAHAEGQLTYSAGFASHAEGTETSSTADATHSEGIKTYAYGAGSHAEGQKTFAYGSTSHAENDQCSAYGNQSHAGGQFTQVSGQCSFGHGFQCKVDASKATALGINANADMSASYVWSAENAACYGADGRYHAKKDGSYCINPANDISGFYIGSNSLDKIILEESRKLLKTYITTSLTIFMSKAKAGTVQNEDVINALTTLYTMANSPEPAV